MDGMEENSSQSLQSLGRNYPGQVVLVLQGGGALGSYQAGVYQALHEAAIEPDWIIGTSIGAINASLIAGNRQHVAWRHYANSGRVLKAITPGIAFPPGPDLATRCLTGRRCVAA